MRDMAIEQEDKGLLLSYARQRGDDVKRLKIISRQKDKKECKEWEKKEEMGTYRTVLGELMVRTGQGM